MSGRQDSRRRSQPFKRNERVGDQILRELASILLSEMGDARLRLVTVSGVEVSKDLRHAKVFVTVLEESTSEECVHALNRASGRLKGLLGARLNMKRTPDLKFFYDDTLAKAFRMDRLLADALTPPRNTGDIDETGETEEPGSSGPVGPERDSRGPDHR